MNRLPVILAALTLAACTPAPAPESRQVEAAPVAPAPDPGAPGKDRDDPRAYCDEYIAGLFDMLVEKKAEGWTERDALDDMIARGEQKFGGPLVDGVFGDRFGPGGGAIARAETLAACRRTQKGGSLY